MSDQKVPPVKAAARWLALLLLLLAAVSPAQALDYVFPGALPIGCADNGGGNYACTALTLAAGDTFTIASPKPATITFNGAFSVGAGVLINSGGVTADLKVVINGAFTLGAGSTLKATVQTQGAGAVTVAAGSTITGSVATETGDVTIGGGGRIGGAISTVTGAVTLGADASVGEGIITVTGYVVVGAGASIDGPVSTLQSGYVTLGANARVGGAITVSGAGYVTLGASAAVNGDISTVSDAITVGADARVDGDLTVSQTGAVTLGDSAKVFGDISTSTGAITIGANARVDGDLAVSQTGAATVGANAVVRGVISTNGTDAIGVGAVADVYAVCCDDGTGSCATIAASAKQPLICPSRLDHYELTVPATSISCLPTTVTVTACANGSNPCSSIATGVAASATLVSSAGTITSALLSNGVGTATLSHPLATDGTLVTVSLLSATSSTNNAATCTNGNCSTRFNTAGFIFSATPAGAVTNLPTQVAGVGSGTYYLRAVRTGTDTAACVSALTGPNTVNWAHQCNDPTSCASSNLMRINGGTATVIARNDNAAVSSYSPVAMTFDANGSAPFNFIYGDVGRVSLWASKTVNSAPLLGRSNPFVVRPHHFALSDIQQAAAPNVPNPAAANALGAKFIKAGEPFSVTVTAMNAGNSATPNYGKEITPEGVKLVSQLASGLGLGSNPALSGSFGAFDQGVATSSTAYRWNDVGIITLTPSIADQDYLGAGDTIGDISGNVGRFYAAQFALSDGGIANRTDIAGHEVSGCGAFTYMGERMNAKLTLTAQTVDGLTTQNYSAANGFAKLDPQASGNPLAFGAVDGAVPTALSARLDTSLTASGRFVDGVAVVTTPLALSRGASPSGPYEQLDIGIAPQDSDGTRMTQYDLDTTGMSPAGSDRSKVARTAVRFGRLQMLNAYGSEALALPVPLTAQYWKGEGYYVTNTDDSCTVLPIASITMGNYLKQLTACETQLSPTGNRTLLNGQLSAPGLVLNKPGAGNAGSVDLRINLSVLPLGSTCVSATESAATAANMPWFGSDPTARATFGIYKSRLIYLRENY